MIKQYPTPYRHAGPLASGSAEPSPGDIVKVLADGSIAAYSSPGTATAYAVFFRKRLDDGKYETLHGIIASFKGESGNIPQVGGNAFIVDAQTVSSNNSGGSRPLLGTCLGPAPDGTYYVYVKGLLK